jgi:hypothetical protein
MYHEAWPGREPENRVRCHEPPGAHSSAYSGSVAVSARQAN